MLGVCNFFARWEADRRYEPIAHRGDVMVKVRRFVEAEGVSEYSRDELEEAVNALARKHYGSGFPDYEVRRLDGRLWVLEGPRPGGGQVWVMNWASGEAWLVWPGEEVERLMMTHQTPPEGDR
jgi:hypothetical protein